MARSNLVSISVSPPSVFQINITNTQNIATPVPFQQMVQLPISQLGLINPYIRNIGPLRFSYNGSYIPAWLESINNGVATIWVKLPVSIPANSSITIDIEVDPSLDFDGNYWGENPLLSSTYGEYDNGASVFYNYWNFAGTSSPSGINVYTNAGSVTFNNGVTIKGGTSQTSGANGIATSSSFSAPIVFDYYGTQSTSPPNAPWAWNEIGFSNNLNPSYYPNSSGTYTLVTFQEGTNAVPSTTQGGTITYGSLPTPSSNLFPNSVWTQIYDIVAYYTNQNYSTTTGYIIGASNTASLPFEIEVGNNEGSYAPNGMTVYWLRTRAYPPSGVMPTVEVIV